MNKLNEWAGKGTLLLEVNTNLRPVRNREPQWLLDAVPMIARCVQQVRVAAFLERLGNDDAV